MARKKRVDMPTLIVDSDLLRRLSTSQSLWFEAPEEIEDGLEWGRRKAELLRWVRRTMGRKLTQREWRCIELHFFKDLTYGEVGLLLGTSTSSVHRAVHRALSKLREAAKRRRGKRSNGVG